jgi:hypothetical protein
MKNLGTKHRTGIRMGYRLVLIGFWLLFGASLSRPALIPASASTFEQPVIYYLNPERIAVDTPDVELTVFGNFDTDNLSTFYVLWDGNPLSTSHPPNAPLYAQVPEGLLSSPGVHQITVLNYYDQLESSSVYVEVYD